MTQPPFDQSDNTRILLEFEMAARAEVLPPDDAHVIGEPVSAIQIRYSGSPQAGLLATCRRRPSRKPTVARFAVYGKPLCRIEDAVRFGERLRRAVMGRAKRVLGDECVPPVLSGHGASDRSHMHAFYLPEPVEPSGQLTDRIHHALVYAPAGFDHGAIAVLDQMRRVSAPDGIVWQLVLEGIGSTSALRSPLLDAAPEWVSVTPYLHPWHRKPRFEIADQIRRECGERGLPTLESVEPIPEIVAGGRALRPIHFHRFRTKRGLTQPDRRGSFWRLRFAEPAHGPIALGFACHFGLGLFAPLREP